MSAREPINVADYERLAAERLDPGVLGYFAGGAGDERTLHENVAAYGRYTVGARITEIAEGDLLAIRRLAAQQGEG